MPHREYEKRLNTITIDGSVLNKVDRGNFVDYEGLVITKAGVMNEAYKSPAEITQLFNFLVKFDVSVPFTEGHPDNQFGMVTRGEDVRGNVNGPWEMDDETFQISGVATFPSDSDYIDKIDSGENLDNSIGFFAIVEKLEKGKFFDDNISGKKKRYTEAEKNIFINHVAGLKNGTGACSFDDGCGFVGTINISEEQLMKNARKNIDMKDLPKFKQEKEDEIFKILADFENETGTDVDWVSISRTWNDSLETYGPMEGVSIAAFIKNQMNGRVKHLKNGEVAGQTFRTCLACGSTVWGDEGACVQCGNIDYWMVLQVTETEVEGDADEMIWTLKTLEMNIPTEYDFMQQKNGAGEPELNKEKINALGEACLKDNDYVKGLIAQINELEDYKAKVDEAELTALREEMGSILADSPLKEKYNLAEMDREKLLWLKEYHAEVSTNEEDPEEDPEVDPEADAEIPEGKVANVSKPGEKKEKKGNKHSKAKYVAGKGYVYPDEEE